MLRIEGLSRVLPESASSAGAHTRRPTARRRAIKGAKATRVPTVTRRDTARKLALRRRKQIKTSRPTGQGSTTILEGLVMRPSPPTA
jgi:hypothetical protein